MQELEEITLEQDKNNKYIVLDNLQNAEEDETDDILFKTKTKTNDNLVIGLNTVLQCLQIAEDLGYVEPIDFNWWKQTACRRGYEIN